MCDAGSSPRRKKEVPSSHPDGKEELKPNIGRYNGKDSLDDVEKQKEKHDQRSHTDAVNYSPRAKLPLKSPDSSDQGIKPLKKG